MNRRKRFIVTGASTYGVDNHGDDAMLSCLIRGLKKKYKNPEIIFLARHPNKKFDTLNGFKSLKNLDHDHKDLAKNRFFLGMNSNDKTTHLNKISKAISKADMLILGGNLFMEVHKNSFLEGVSSYTATLAILARFHSVPISLFGVNVVDEIKDKTTIDHANFLVGVSRAVTVREKHVIQRFKKINLNNLKNVKVFGDPAYGVDIKTDKSFAIKNVLNKIGLNPPKDKKIIGVNIRYEYFKGFKKKQLDKFFKKISGLIEKIDKEFNPFFLFIPNCTYKKSNPWHNDVLVHQSILKNIKKKIDYHLVKDNLNLFETLSLFKVVDLHITNRRHSFIFASLMNKPSIIINGSWAYHQAPVLNELGLTNQLYNMKDPEKKLISKIKKTFSDYRNIKKKLKKNIEYLRKRSENQVKYITQKI